MIVTANYDGSLKFDTKIDTTGFKAGTNTIKTQANGLKSTLLGLSKMMLAVFSITALITFGKQAIDTASDLKEVQNVVDTAFGDMAYKIEDFAKSSIDNFGLSKLAAKQMASTYMAMSVGMGQAADTASDMAVTVTGRLGDVMSFYNKTQSEVDTIGKAIYTGETEPLKAIGVIMTETNLELFRLQKGFSKAYTEMSAHEKLLVRQQFFLEKTSLAAGDFVKTQDGWANQTRVLSERFKEFLGIMGNGLIQVFLPAVRLANQAMAELIELSTRAGETLSKVFGLEAETSAAGSATAAYTDLADAKETAATAGTDKTTADFDTISKMTFNESSASGTTTASITEQEATAAAAKEATAAIAEEQVQVSWLEATLLSLKETLSGISGYLLAAFLPVFIMVFAQLIGPAEAFRDNLVGVFGDISTLIQPTLDFLTNYLVPYFQQEFGTIGTIAVGLFNTFVTVFDDIWTIAIFPLTEKMISDFLPALYEFGTAAWDLLETMFNDVKYIFDMIWSDAIAPALGLATKIWLGFIDTIIKFWDDWGVPIFTAIEETWTTMVNLFSNLWDTVLEPVWSTFMSVLDEIWVNHLQPLLANFLDFVGTFVTGATTIYNEFIAPILDWFINKFGPPIVAVLQRVLKFYGGLAGSLIEGASNIIDALKGIINFLVDVFTGDWEGAWEDIKGVFKSIFFALVDIVRTPINLIIDIVNSMISGVADGVNTVIGMVNGMSFDVPDWVPKIGGQTLGFNIPALPSPKAIAHIPMLATGTVVPANYGQFLSILGDNTRETEVVSPLSTIKQSVLEALAEAGIGKEIVLQLILTGDLAALARILKPVLEAEDKRVGTRLVVSGGSI